MFLGLLNLLFEHTFHFFYCQRLTLFLICLQIVYICLFRCRHTFLDSTLLKHFRETRNSIIPPKKFLISSGMNVLKKKEEFKVVFYKILRKQMMTLLQEKSINRNQTLTKNDEIGENERFSQKLFQAKFLLANRIKIFHQ